MSVIITGTYIYHLNSPTNYLGTYVSIHIFYLSDRRLELGKTVIISYTLELELSELQLSGSL